MNCAACGFDERGVFMGKLEGENVGEATEERFESHFFTVGNYYGSFGDDEYDIGIYACPKCKTLRLL